jgi:hypothetical protein
MYWSEKLFGLRKMKCTVHWDPANIGWVLVVVHEKGKPDQKIIATSDEYDNWNEGDYDTLRKIKKQEREVQEKDLEKYKHAAAGIKPYHQVLMEVNARRQPESCVVNGVPLITEGHHIANAFENTERPARSRINRPSATPRLPVRVMDEETPSAALPFRLPDYIESGSEVVGTGAGDCAVCGAKRPLFSSEFDRDQWELQHLHLFGRIPGEVQE